MILTAREYRKMMEKKAKPKRKNNLAIIKEKLNRERFIAELACQGITAVAEYQFHPKRKWRFDFAIPEKKIAIEIDGGVWIEGGGRHNRASGFLGDLKKFNAAAELGWRVLKYTPQEQFLPDTIDQIKRTSK